MSAQAGIITNPWWSLPADELLTSLATSPAGLTTEEARQRQTTDPNTPRNQPFRLFLLQFKSPITLLLIFASLLSFFLGEKSDAFIILAILLISGLLGFFQEKGASGALAKLIGLVQTQITVLRDGQPATLPRQSVVPGDIILLTAGSTIPGDCRLLQSKELHTNESSLTGESFPVEKACASLPAPTALAARSNCLFMGTHVISGTATAVVVNTGAATVFGELSSHLRRLQPETEFERGIRRFGYLLLEVTLLLVIIIFAINVLLHKPALDAFLFSLAIAVGLTPQLLPAIISINLAKGAANMARRSVIVKRLSSIENFGSMDILCCDKTGTITTGEIVLQKAVDCTGNEQDSVFRLAYINAIFEQGFANPIDLAIRNHKTIDITGLEKADEIPYDFIRRRLSVLVTSPSEQPLLIAKGAFDNILSACTPTDAAKSIRSLYEAYSQDGFRVLGIATKKMPGTCRTITKEDEKDMTLAGLLLFSDPLKPSIQATLARLTGLGIGLKIITGDNPVIAARIAKDIGLSAKNILTGEQIKNLGIDALSRLTDQTSIFASIEPGQKEKILLALKKAGHVVGYLGDGINDAPALHAADVGISVDSAADVAKEAADIVLLKGDLNVLAEGVKEGRKTFANTLKYIFMATSANFGNMFSMAGASLFLPFLPLLPKQVLLTNLLTDIPEMTIATDTVDPSMMEKPRRIDLRFIGRFMIVFGIVSSLFDYATFTLLLYWLKASPAQFRTGWFVESVVSASLIVLVVRTSRPFFKNRPGKLLLLSTLAVIIITVCLPQLPAAALLGFTPLPLTWYAAIAGIILLYMAAAEIAKRFFYSKRLSPRPLTHVIK